METNGVQHWPVLHLVGIHRSPHNEGRPSAAHPTRLPPPSAAAILLGFALLGDLWIPTRCSTGQCCPPLVSTCTTQYSRVAALYPWLPPVTTSCLPHQVWHHTNGYKHPGMFFVFLILLWGSQPKPLCGNDPEPHSAPGRWNNTSPTSF